MEFIIVKNKDEGNEIAYKLVKNLITEKPNAVLGLATGTTPLGLYQNMIDDCNSNNISYKDVTTYNLDEYVGLDEEHEQSYRYFMNHNLFNRLDINLNNTYVPNGYIPNGVGDAEKNAEDYEKTLESIGPADIQILGIGSNGHIAFNEPGTPFDSVTHVTDLTESTIKDNSRFFSNIDEVPTKAITMGIKSILRAKKIILLAYGENKSDALSKLAAKKEDINCPATALVRHDDVTVICDEEAAMKLQLKNE